MKTIRGVALTLALSAFPAIALAQSGSMQGGMGSSNMGMHGSMKGSMQGMSNNMMGSHMMPATVTAVDPKTGIMDVMSEGMALKLHFPPPAVAEVKKGDKVTIHMAFSKS